MFRIISNWNRFKTKFHWSHCTFKDCCLFWYSFTYFILHV